jgi:hypothetical protein
MFRPGKPDVYLTGCRPWDRGRMDASPTCWGCGDGELIYHRYCLVCDRYAFDPFIAIGAAYYAGDPVGRKIRLEWMTAEELEAKATALEKAALEMGEQAALEAQGEALMYREEARKRPHAAKPTTYTPPPEGLKGGRE